MSFHLITERFFDLSKPDEVLQYEGVHGFEGCAKAPFLASFFEQNSKSIAVIFKGSDEAEHFYIETKNFVSDPETAVYFGINDEMQRTTALSKIINKEKIILISSVKAMQKGTYKRNNFKNKLITFKKGQNISFSSLSQKIIEAGYERSYIAEEEGEVSFRGGIIDIVSSDQMAVRIEFAFDIVESIRSYDTVSQRSIKDMDEVVILPVKEDEEAPVLNFFREKPDIFVDEAAISDDQDIVLSGSKSIVISRIPLENNSLQIECLLPGVFALGIGNFLNNLRLVGHETFVITKQSLRVKEILAENDLSSKASVLQGEISSGFILKEKNIAVYGDREIFGEQIPKRRFKQTKEKLASRDLSVDFNEGEPVVHKNYGIGIYEGIVAQTVEGATSDYLYIRYAQNDRLYVPIDQMHLISRYGFSLSSMIRLNRLGGNEWQLAKRKAKKSIKDMTKELLEIYSTRKTAKRPPFLPDTNWQREFESAFVYEETPDQLKAIDRVKRDMESDKPMDHLVCGDVGYGKTEVALRAAFKAVQSGKQVAILVPTTVLAEQHYKTFKERFAAFPFFVEMLSRFRGKPEQKQIISKLAEGSIDIVIGTHRLIQKDVIFKDLGLLIIDEEHRFGVSHKEKIKKIKRSVDCLTMTATPIPRTLYMSLSGIWDIDIIETPPPGRTQIATYIMPWSKDIIKNAIENEIERGGQIFYLHNRVKTIFATAKKLKDLFPKLKISVGHGQMKETELEKAMTDFIEGRTDVLVCTAIIESGIDIPNANTIIIEDPQNFGLSTLYQLKGRVGRSTVKASAYLLYNRGFQVTGKALDRLSAIKSFAKLGSGQKIAMKDLEIRGAGNVLGAQQHGHMMAVGFDLYCDMLTDTALEFKGLKVPELKETIVDIMVDAFISAEYISDEKERIAVYRNMNFVRSKEELQALMDELRDRFGQFPLELKNLFELLQIKIEALSKDVLKIKQCGALVLIEKEKKTEKYNIKYDSQDDIVKELKRIVRSI